MKATKPLIAAAALAGLASLSFAGPGPDYWTRMAETAKARTAAPKLETKATVKPAAEVAASCTTCQCNKAKKS